MDRGGSRGVGKATYFAHHRSPPIRRLPIGVAMEAQTEPRPRERCSAMSEALKPTGDQATYFAV